MFDSLAKIQARILMLSAASALAGILAGCGGGHDDDYQPPAPSPCAAKPPATDGGLAAPSGCRRG